MAIRLLSLALATGLLLLANGANAETIRCGNYLIQDGERSGATKYEILKKCGEPASRMGHTRVWLFSIDSQNPQQLLQPLCRQAPFTVQPHQRGLRNVTVTDFKMITQVWARLT